MRSIVTFRHKSLIKPDLTGVDRFLAIYTLLYAEAPAEFPLCVY
jgi:hypothetical protein